MAFLPVRRTADEVNYTNRGKQKIGELAAVLPQILAKITKPDGVEDLVLLELDPLYAQETGRTPQDAVNAAKVNRLIGAISAPILQAMHQRQLFIAADVLDSLIYDAAAANSPNIVFDVLKRIRDARALRPGMLIFPLHSLGVLAAGLLSLQGRRVSFLDPIAGLAISPQTNAMARTMQFLDEARVALGVKQNLPEDLLAHWRRSRPTKWLERNPLLAMRVRHLPGGGFYTNEYLLLSRLQAATAQIALLAALQPPNENRAGTLFSSARMNNFETLDIRHYIALFDTGGERKTMAGDCVPIHRGRTGVVDLSGLDLDLDPRYWRRYSANHDRVRTAVSTIYSGHLGWLTGAAKDTAPTRTYRRLFTALTYFRRSFRASADDFAALVMLSTAFELMLTDSSGGVTEALTKNSKILLKGTKGVNNMVAAVGDTYEARCSLVHAGRSASVDIDLARRAFALCFIVLSQRVGRIPTTTSTPIGEMLGA